MTCGLLYLASITGRFNFKVSQSVLFLIKKKKKKSGQYHNYIAAIAACVLVLGLRRWYYTT